MADAERFAFERVATPAHTAITVGEVGDLPDDVKWKPAKHLLYVNERVTRACLAPHQTFLDLEISVRHGKSLLVSGYTPFWYLGMFPDRRVALVSYNADFASEWGDFTRELVELYGPELFGIEMDPRKKAKHTWGVKGRRGGVVATGVNGKLTGKGYDLICLPAEAEVMTTIGLLPIGDLYALEHRPLVLSWNHESEVAEWKPVTAAQETTSEELIEITTRSGRVVRCTPDHRVFDVERGYRAAELVGVGDLLLSTQGWPVPEVRGAQGREGSDVPGLLQRTAEAGGSVDLRRVRPDSRQAPSRSAQGGTTQPCPLLLRDDVSRRVDGEDQTQEVRGLPGAPAEEHPEAVRRLQGRASETATAARQDVPGVRSVVSAEVKSDGALLAGLRQPCALGADEGRRELALQGWSELRQVVQGDAAPGDREGRGVRCLSVDGAPNSPPRQRASVGQPGGEPRHPLPDLSCDPSQVEHDPVVMVRRVRHDDKLVYDVTVEGNHNFFAEGVLVHNCIDDPIKNREQADSAAERKTLRSGYYSNIRTRLMQQGTMILTMARWREDDLAGDVVHGYSHAEGADGTDADDWEVIRLPALAEPAATERLTDEERAEWRDELGRKEGEALWPEAWPEEALRKLRSSISLTEPDAWDSLYQQNPTAKEGKDFKIDTWIVLPHVDRARLRLVRFWDLAASKNAGDWTVGMLVGMDSDNKTYVLDVQRFRKDSAEVEKHVRMTAEHDGISVPVRIEQEKSGSGKALASTYTRLLVGFDVDAKQPDGSKEARASAVASQQQQGRVVLLRADWNATLIEEARTFPNGRWDDQVDALSGGFNFLALAGPSSMETEYQLNTPLASLFGNSRPVSLPGAVALEQAHATMFGR